MTYSTCSGPCSRLLPWRARNLLSCGSILQRTPGSSYSPRMLTLMTLWNWADYISDGNINIRGYNVQHSERFKKKVWLLIFNKKISACVVLTEPRSKLVTDWKFAWMVRPPRKHYDPWRILLWMTYSDLVVAGGLSWFGSNQLLMTSNLFSTDHHMNMGGVVFSRSKVLIISGIVISSRIMDPV